MDGSGWIIFLLILEEKVTMHAGWGTQSNKLTAFHLPIDMEAILSPHILVCLSSRATQKNANYERLRNLASAEQKGGTKAKSCDIRDRFTSVCETFLLFGWSSRDVWPPFEESRAFGNQTSPFKEIGHWDFSPQLPDLDDGMSGIRVLFATACRSGSERRTCRSLPSDQIRSSSFSP
jgi:hypothetical protein